MVDVRGTKQPLVNLVKDMLKGESLGPDSTSGSTGTSYIIHPGKASALALFVFWQEITLFGSLNRARRKL